MATPESEFVDILERTASNTGTEWDPTCQRIVLTRFLAHLTETDPTIPAKFQDFVALQAKEENVLKARRDCGSSTA